MEEGGVERETERERGERGRGREGEEGQKKKKKKVEKRAGDPLLQSRAALGSLGWLPEAKSGAVQRDNPHQKIKVKSHPMFKSVRGKKIPSNSPKASTRTH